MRPHLIFGPKYFWEIGPPLFQGVFDRPPPPPSLIVRSGSGTVDRILMIPYKRGYSFVL